MKKLELPDMKKEWNEIFKAMDKKNLKLSESEIQKEIAFSKLFTLTTSTTGNEYHLFNTHRIRVYFKRGRSWQCLFTIFCAFSSFASWRSVIFALKKTRFICL
jgi:hypothetical protein